jgi:hypothetical protein
LEFEGNLWCFSPQNLCSKKINKNTNIHTTLVLISCIVRSGK